jgi:hypothetical protein
MAMGIHYADHVTPSIRKSRHYFADSSGRSVGIVRLRTKAAEFSLVLVSSLHCIVHQIIGRLMNE